MSDPDLDELASELSEFAQTQKPVTRSAREERIIAGFEEIQRFVDEHGRQPLHGEGNDIFERLYAVRLGRLRSLKEGLELIKPLDYQNLLTDAGAQDENLEELDDEELLSELSGLQDQDSSITRLKHVRSTSKKQSAEEIANRESCKDFEKFKPIFERVVRELENNVRTSRVIRKDAGFLKTSIKVGDFFILGGLTLYIAEVGRQIKAPNGEMDARLRVIYSNGTESNILLRSLQRAIYKDETSRRVSEPSAGPLFSDQLEDEDMASGTIYVLRSKSELPQIAKNREIIHKIGVTTTNVEQRIAGARLDPTYLMADVEVVATYELFNINRTKLENIFHKIFSPAQLDIAINDRFGRPVKPREWFQVPLFVVDEAVEKIKDGTITSYIYDTSTAKLIPKSI